MESILPRRSARLFGWFRWYSKRYLTRHFHAVRVSKSGPLPDLPHQPLIVVVNHPSWWDPLVGLLLSESMPNSRVHYAPIEAIGLAQYRFLERLGFFGIDSGTPRGGLKFLKTSLAILSRPDSVLWITAQGEFVNPRERPIRLKPGIGHVIHRLKDVTVVTLAIEYPFWNDRCPEVVTRFGSPISVESGRSLPSHRWTSILEEALEQTQDELAHEARSRDPDAFTTILGGTAGVGGVYDIWRRLQSLLGGTRFRADHSAGRAVEDGPHPGSGSGRTFNG